MLPSMSLYQIWLLVKEVCLIRFNNYLIHWRDQKRTDDQLKNTLEMMKQNVSSSTCTCTLIILSISTYRTFIFRRSMCPTSCWTWNATSFRGAIRGNSDTCKILSRVHVSGNRVVKIGIVIWKQLFNIIVVL